MDYSGMDFNNLINFLHQNCWLILMPRSISKNVDLCTLTSPFGYAKMIWVANHPIIFWIKMLISKRHKWDSGWYWDHGQGVSEAWPNAPSSPQHQNSLELVTLEKLQLQTKGCHPYPITADNRCLYLKPKQVALHSWAADRERRCRSNCDQDVMSGKIQFPNWGWVPQWDMSRALIMSDIGTDRACLILL